MCTAGDDDNEDIEDECPAICRVFADNCDCDCS
jgi:hypothetical protein